VVGLNGSGDPEAGGCQQIKSKLDVYVRVAVEFSRVEQSNGEVTLTPIERRD
jgi:hypothetical protein